jgi:hypothetical protein
MVLEFHLESPSSSNHEEKEKRGKKRVSSTLDKKLQRFCGRGKRKEEKNLSVRQVGPF